MSSRKFFTGPIVLVILGAGAWWVLADKDSQENSAASVREAPPQSAPGSPIHSVEGTKSNDPIARLDKPPQDSAQSPGKPSTQNMALKFAGRENPDPALSNELELGIQKALDASIDRGRFDVESVICRENTCQIISVDRTPPPAISGRPPDLQNGWGSSLKNLLVQLNDAGMQNPRTGAWIDKPKMVQLEIMHAGEIVTYLEFKERSPN